jgi:hypothetical protein
MTEEQWLSAEEPYAMLRHLRQHGGLSRMQGGRRLQRLFACACCRRAWHLFGDERERRVIETAERAADGKASRQELADAAAGAASLVRERDGDFVRGAPPQGSPEWNEAVVRRMLAYAVQSVASNWLSYSAGGPAMSVPAALSYWAARQTPAAQGEVQQAEMRRMAGLLRDLFGNSFRPPPAVDAAWAKANGGVVARMAQAIYDGHCFGDLPALADALQEAGCADAEVLGHCRGGEHARGCWLVDRLLGKR